MVLLESTMMPLATSAHDFNLKGIDGKFYSLESFADKAVLVIVFMCNHCPYVQAVWGRLNKLQNDYAESGVQFVGVNPNASNPKYPEDNFEEMKKAPEEFGMNFPYLIDETQEIARAYGAVCTPDIFVYDEEPRAYARGFFSLFLSPTSPRSARKTLIHGLTPVVFGFKSDKDRKLVYRGRVDNNWKDEGAVTKHELREALDALISGADVLDGQRPSVGCSIKWLS